MTHGFCYDTRRSYIVVVVHRRRRFRNRPRHVTMRRRVDTIMVVVAIHRSPCRSLSTLDLHFLMILDEPLRLNSIRSSTSPLIAYYDNTPGGKNN
jgi:hypothetical protein